MKFITFEINGEIKTGIVQENEVIDITNLYGDLNDVVVVENFNDIKEVISKNKKNYKYNLNEVKLLPPIDNPRRNIICVGWNYLEHFEERFDKSIELPLQPTIFTKATTTVAGPYDDIPLSTDITESFDYEAELAVVIGKKGKRIKEDEAFDYIFGYMNANDLTARDIQQKHGGQWFMGKSIDKTCPIGPWLLSKDEVPDVQNLNIICKVNGQTVQSSNTNLMIFPIKKIISELSRGMTLLPGDIILTGTPSGVGFKRTPPLALKDGDVVEVEIEKIGRIENKLKLELGGKINGNGIKINKVY